MKSCPFCKCIHPQIEESQLIFHGQIYSGRGYPKEVAEQNNGYRIRCPSCGCQTCWWHYKKEARKAWNKRVTS